MVENCLVWICTLSSIVFLVGHVVSEKFVQVPTCNRHLNGKRVTVHNKDGSPVKIQLSITNPGNVICKYGDDRTWYEIPNNNSDSTTYFNDDGSLGITLSPDEHYYQKNEFCVMGVKDTFMDIKFCKPNCTRSHPCIKKCCPFGRALDLSSVDDECQPINKGLIWSPYIYSDPYSTKSLNKSQFTPHFIHYLLQSEYRCSKLDTLFSDSFTVYIQGKEHQHQKLPFKLLEDGSLAYINTYRKWVTLKTEHFCIDAFQYSDAQNKRIGSGLENEQVIITCRISPLPNRFSKAYMIGMYIASIFLLLTCIVYLLLWDKQNVHGWTVFSLVLSMLFMFVFMGTAHLLGLPESTSTPVETENSTSNAFLPVLNESLPQSTSQSEDTSERNSSINLLCKIDAILAHFFFLSIFTWLTCINFDLLITFRSHSSVPGRSKGLKKFALYAVVSWGLPFIIVMVGLILDHMYPDKESLVLVPEYGTTHCFIAPSAEGVYLYFIISGLLALNLIFVALTFHSIYQVKKISGKIRSNKTNKNETFFLVVKLSIVMGISWIFEVVSWATTKDLNNPAWYWFLLDMYNLFQAVLIFIIFICKRTIIIQLAQKYPVFEVICCCCNIMSLRTTKEPARASDTRAPTRITDSTETDREWKHLGKTVDDASEKNSDVDVDIPIMKSFRKPTQNTPLLYNHSSSK